LYVSIPERHTCVEADEYAWRISERGVRSDHLDPAINKKIQKGVEFKLIIPENVLSSVILQISDNNMEVRGLRYSGSHSDIRERGSSLLSLHWRQDGLRRVFWKRSSFDWLG
jgi:hypothetical protein